MSARVNRIGDILIALCLAMLILTILVMAAVPPVSRDALTHHLAVPKLWITLGGIIEMPEILFSYYPMNLDLLYVVPLLFGNDILPKYIHFLFALATAWLIYLYLKRRTTHALSLVGALIFLSTPVIVKLSISVYVDLGLVFFSWAALFHLCQWARSPQSPKHLIFSAILCGLGLGTKYNGMIVLFLLTLFIPIIFIRSTHRDYHKIKYTAGYPALFFLIALTVFSPWMIKNYALTGNPIYPLYSEQINGEKERSTISNMSMKPWLQRKLIYKESALDTALIPLRIFFQGKDDDPRLFDGTLNPILLLCPLLVLIRRKESDAAIKREQIILASYVVLFILYASFMVDMRVRYIAPVIPPLVVLTIFGIRNILRRIDRLGSKLLRSACQWMTVGVVFFFICINATYAVALFHSVNPLPFIFGETSREEYLSNKLPEYTAIQFANQIQQDHMKILALFLGKRLYYFDRPVEFEFDIFERIVKGTTTRSTLASQMQKYGYTHCILGIDRFESWANRVFDVEQKKNLSQWLKDNCVQLFSGNGYVVLGLISDDVVD